jgi:hypothetical protein
MRAKSFCNAQKAQNVCSIGADLDASAFLMESGAPFQNMRCDPTPR